MNPFYHPPKKGLWSGRKSTVATPEYWHEAIRLIDLGGDDDLTTKIALIGYACDEASVETVVDRERHPDPMPSGSSWLNLPSIKINFSVGDMGNLQFGENQSLETFQKEFAKVIYMLLKGRVFPIGLGGGHDLSYAHFQGIYNALYQEGKQFGIVNFDAHFDLRKEDRSTSGTPFHQILTQYGAHTNYLALGIRESANPRSLFQTARETNSRWIALNNCSIADFQPTQDALDALISRVDHLT